MLVGDNVNHTAPSVVKSGYIVSFPILTQWDSTFEEVAMSFTVEDLEKVQVQLGDEYRVEWVDGEILLISPSGYESEEVAAQVMGKLFPYVKANRLGRITASTLI
jgi:Uma2 family endonuclease